MFECHPVFTSNLYYKHLDVDNNAIIKDCLTVKSHDSGRNYSNYGGYQSNDLSFEFLNQNRCFDLIKLIQYIQRSILDLPQRLGPLCLDNIWININGKGSGNNQHDHPGVVMSGTYYVTDTNENNGPICFYRERAETLYLMHAYNDTRHEPELSTFCSYGFPNGSLIIFPSYLQHSVNSNMTNDARLSISFNIKRP